VEFHRGLFSGVLRNRGRFLILGAREVFGCCGGRFAERGFAGRRFLDGRLLVRRRFGSRDVRNWRVGKRCCYILFWQGGIDTFAGLG